MDKKIWAIVKPGKELFPLMVLSEQSGEKMARAIFQDKIQSEIIERIAPGPYKIALLAVKSWRKYRGRLFQKAVDLECTGRVCGFRYTREDKHDLKNRITPAAVVVLKELDV